MKLNDEINIRSGGPGSGRHSTGRKIKQPKPTVIKKSGEVSLVTVERDGVKMYGVSYPRKLGGGNEFQSFLNQNEAENTYDRYDKFFNPKGD
jgi:hypothetical protein